MESLIGVFSPLAIQILMPRNFLSDFTVVFAEEFALKLPGLVCVIFWFFQVDLSFILRLKIHKILYSTRLCQAHQVHLAVNIRILFAEIIFISKLGYQGQNDTND